MRVKTFSQMPSTPSWKSDPQLTPAANPHRGLRPTQPFRGISVYYVLADLERHPKYNSPSNHIRHSLAMAHHCFFPRTDSASLLDVSLNGLCILLPQTSSGPTTGPPYQPSLSRSTLSESILPQSTCHPPHFVFNPPSSYATTTKCTRHAPACLHNNFEIIY